MTEAACSEKDFIHLFEKYGAQKLAVKLDQQIRTVYKRRLSIEKSRGITIVNPTERGTGTRVKVDHPARVGIEIQSGHVIIGSDSHYWPGLISTAHKGFVKLCKELKPKIVIKNGDELDGSQISRHPPIGWEDCPTLEDEVGTVAKRLREIREAAPKAELVWPLGNHDARFETRLATIAPEFARIHGVHLTDHFPAWHPCWSCWLNDDVIVKHRFKGGDHAAYNNAVKSGKTMVTGHLHRLVTRPYNDYNENMRWGIECGTIADPNGPQFRDYSEDNPKDHHSGFVVLTFHKGRLLTPEPVHVMGESIVFRGQVISV